MPSKDKLPTTEDELNLLLNEELNKPSNKSFTQLARDVSKIISEQQEEQARNGYCWKCGAEIHLGVSDET